MDSLFPRDLAAGRRSFDDPFFEDGNLACGFLKRMCVFDVDDEELCHEISQEFCCEVPGCTSTFKTLMEFEIHYNTLHRYVCSVCHKTLPSPHFLDLHIEENHDSFFSLQAERKPSYQCLVEECKTKFRTVGERKDHCLKTHSFPPNFRWLMPPGNPQKPKSKRSKPRKNTVDAEMIDQNLISSPSETLMEDETAPRNSSQGKKKNRKKKSTDKNAEMDIECENLGSNSDQQMLDASNKTSVSSLKSKKSPAPFKGFIPRNVTANRAFYQKACFKGSEWHQNAATSVATSSTLESDTLSVDLRESLPADMDDC